MKIDGYSEHTHSLTYTGMRLYIHPCTHPPTHTEDLGKSPARLCDRVQELCESRGGRPGLFVLTSLMVFVDVKQH